MNHLLVWFRGCIWFIDVDGVENPQRREPFLSIVYQYVSEGSTLILSQSTMPADYSSFARNP